MPQPNPDSRFVIVDGHEDIAYNWVQGRDFLKSAHEKQKLEPPNTPRGLATVGLPDLLAANVRVVFATIWVAPCSAKEFIEPGDPCYQTPQEAHNQARKQLDYYLKLTKDPRITLIRNHSELEFALNPSESRVGFVILMEGADPLLTPQQAKEWFDAGVRIIAPAWRGTRYAGGTGNPGPLTPIGRELMVEMKRAGLILDISHLAEASFFEALELFQGPVMASHSNCRSYVPTDRQLSDQMIQALVKREAVIGVVLYNRFLKAGWKRFENAKSEVTLQNVAKHMKHTNELAGDTLHVGLGSDFDGGFGVEGIPAEMDTVADLTKIGEALLTQEHLSQADVRGILGENWLRFLRKALPK